MCSYFQLLHQVTGVPLISFTGRVAVLLKDVIVTSVVDTLLLMQLLADLQC